MSDEELSQIAEEADKALQDPLMDLKIRVIALEVIIKRTFNIDYEAALAATKDELKRNIVRETVKELKEENE